jgi:hypothetical protein
MIQLLFLPFAPSREFPMHDKTFKQNILYLTCGNFKSGILPVKRASCRYCKAALLFYPAAPGRSLLLRRQYRYMFLLLRVFCLAEPSPTRQTVREQPTAKCKPFKLKKAKTFYEDSISKSHKPFAVGLI